MSARRHRWRMRARRVPSVVEATACLALARIDVADRFGDRWQRVLGERVETAHEPPWRGPEAPVGAAAVAHDVERAIRSAAARVPWDTRCLVQSVAAMRMLRRRGYPSRTFVGGRRDTATHALDLHSWTVVGEETVTGGGESETFTPIVAYDRHLGSVGQST